MYRNFIYISYVCVFTGGMLQTEVGREKESNRMLFLFIPSSPSVVVSSSESIPLFPQRGSVLSVGDACAPLTLLLCGRTGRQWLSLSFTPPSLTHSSLPSPSLSLSHTHAHFLWVDYRSTCLLNLPFTLLLLLPLCVTDTLLSQCCPLLFCLFLLAQSSLLVFLSSMFTLLFYYYSFNSIYILCNFSLCSLSIFLFFISVILF